jgi:hypothetical protein
VLIPDSSGLDIISTAGLSPFSKVVQVHKAPFPGVSKSIGIFWPNAEGKDTTVKKRSKIDLIDFKFKF